MKLRAFYSWNPCLDIQRESKRKVKRTRGKEMVEQVSRKLNVLPSYYVAAVLLSIYVQV